MVRETNQTTQGRAQYTGRKQKPLKMASTINFPAKLGSQLEELAFYMDERLETSVILGCDF